MKISTFELGLSVAKLRLLGFALCTILLANSARADFLVLPTSYSADLSVLPARSLESAFVLRSDYQYLGVRRNWRVGENSLLHIDVGMTDINAAVGFPIGIGWVRQLPVLRERYHTALNAHLGIAQLALDDRRLDAGSAGAGIILSPVIPVGTQRLWDWFLTAGVRAVDQEFIADGELESASEVRAILGAGLTYPFLLIEETPTKKIYNGRLHFRIGYSDATEWALGIRYHFD